MNIAWLRMTWTWDMSTPPCRLALRETLRKNPCRGFVASCFLYRGPQKVPIKLCFLRKSPDIYLTTSFILSTFNMSHVAPWAPGKLSCSSTHWSNLMSFPDPLRPRHHIPLGFSRLLHHHEDNFPQASRQTICNTHSTWNIYAKYLLKRTSGRL